MYCIKFVESLFIHVFWCIKFHRYKITKELGDGTCGSVYEAICLETYEIVRTSTSMTWKFIRVRVWLIRVNLF